MLTKQDVERALPANLKSSVTQSLVDSINNIAADPIVAEQIRNNFISYTAVMKEGRFKTEDYVAAVTYVSYKLMGNSNQEAYIKTFPARYQALLAKGTSASDIASYVAAYHRGKLVNLIMEQTLVPTWVLNQDMYQRALNESFSIGLDDKVSPKVRVEALNNVMVQLKRPETSKLQIDMTVKENSGLNELQETLKQLAETQTQLIESGMTTKAIAAAPLIQGEFRELHADQEDAG